MDRDQLSLGASYDDPYPPFRGNEAGRSARLGSTASQPGPEHGRYAALDPLNANRHPFEQNTDTGLAASARSGRLPGRPQGSSLLPSLNDPALSSSLKRASGDDPFRSSGNGSSSVSAAYVPAAGLGSRPREKLRFGYYTLEPVASSLSGYKKQYCGKYSESSSSPFSDGSGVSKFTLEFQDGVRQVNLLEWQYIGPEGTLSRAPPYKIAGSQPLPPSRPNYLPGGHNKSSSSPDGFMPRLTGNGNGEGSATGMGHNLGLPPASASGLGSNTRLAPMTGTFNGFDRMPDLRRGLGHKYVKSFGDSPTSRSLPPLSELRSALPSIGDPSPSLDTRRSQLSRPGIHSIDNPLSSPPPRSSRQRQPSRLTGSLSSTWDADDFSLPGSASSTRSIRSRELRIPHSGRRNASSVGQSLGGQARGGQLGRLGSTGGSSANQSDSLPSLSRLPELRQYQHTWSGPSDATSALTYGSPESRYLGPQRAASSTGDSERGRPGRLRSNAVSYNP